MIFNPERHEELVEFMFPVVFIVTVIIIWVSIIDWLLKWYKKRKRRLKNESIEKTTE